MPKIAEILGPSGVGKSHFYNSLQKIWHENYTWVPYHDFRHKRNRSKKTLPDTARSIVTKIITGLERIDYLSTDDKCLANQKKFYYKYPDFVSTVYNIIEACCKGNTSETDKRFEAILYFMRTTEQYQAVIQKEEDKRLCILYEGFLNRIMHLNFGTFTDDHLKQYVFNMPKPDAVIYLKASPEYVVKNTKKRVRVASVHNGMSKEEIFRYTEQTQKHMKTAISYLKESGVHVQVVDAERDVDEMTPEVLTFLNSIS